MGDIQFMVIDADGWGRVSVLSHDLCFLQANGKPEVLAGIAEASQKAEWAVTAPSSAKRKSRRHRSSTLVFALSLEMLKSFTSVLVRR